MSVFSPFPIDRVVTPDATARDQDLLDFSALAAAIWRHKFWLLILGAMGGALALGWSVRVATPYFQSTAVLVMEPVAEASVDLEAVVPGLTNENSAINTEIEILSSRTLIARVVDEMGLAQDPEFNPKLTVSASAAIFDGMRELGLWPAAPRVDTRLQAELARTATIDRLLEHITVRNVPDSMVFEVTAESTDRVKAARIANALSEHYIARQIELKFAATEAALAWLTVRVDELRVELRGAEEKANAFAARMQIINPDTIEALQLQLVETRQLIKAVETARTRDRTGSRDTARLAEWRSQEAALSEKIVQQSQDLVTLAQLRREAESSRLIYESFLARLKETAVQKGVQQPDSTILSAAEVAEAASRPRPLVMAVVGAGLAIFLASAFILRREASRQTFRSLEELQSTFPLPVLGASRGLVSRRLRSLVSVVQKHPNAPGIEDIRGIRTAVLSGKASQSRTVLVTSALPGEGKSTLAALLAQTMAELGRTVLLIEGDLRRPVLSKALGVNASRRTAGVSDVVAGTVPLKSAVFRASGSSAYTLLSGAKVPNPSALLASRAFDALMEEASATFDHVIIDAPPVLSVPDSRILARLANQVIVAVRWNRTTKDQLERALSMLSGVDAPPRGLALTRLHAPAMRKLGRTEYRSAPY